MVWLKNVLRLGEIQSGMIQVYERMGTHYVDSRSGADEFGIIVARWPAQSNAILDDAG